jgi:hypothetical protein
MPGSLFTLIVTPDAGSVTVSTTADRKSLFDFCGRMLLLRSASVTDPFLISRPVTEFAFSFTAA